MPLSRYQLANAIRILAVDAVEHAQSGHPGMPMGMADIAEVLWNDFLRHNPNNPNWFNRDRFIVSNGHGCMLIYALLHLTGYDLSLEEIKNFRRLHSKTPGHPEYGITAGVETTTGPLGQGISNAVGMALAEKILAARFNKPNYPLVDHFTYVFCGDGCLMEGISHEACSLAGTLKLGKLILFYDDNDISIDGHVSKWFTDDTAKRFAAYGWQVIANIDGHNPEAIKKAIQTAQAETEKPTIICCKTIIGYGAPNLAGKNKAHSDPMGAEEIALIRKQLAWSCPAFEIPKEIYQAYDAKDRGNDYETNWKKLWTDYQKNFPNEAKQFNKQLTKSLPENWQEICNAFLQKSQMDSQPLATRKASQKSLNTFAPYFPELIGGSADLTTSNCTEWQGSKAYSAEQIDSNYIYYGVREFGMFGIMNGLALHGGFIPYGGTFLTFIDYGRNAIRLAAMMKQQVIYILTHDSIGLGQDGPTHQPIEHINILRNTPELSIWRPADNCETIIAWKKALENQNQPTCLLLTRQNVSQLPRDETMLKNIEYGGYIIYEPQSAPTAIMIATGSEVQLAIAAAKNLAEKQLHVRVVSMPSTDTFAKQSKIYQEKILPNSIRKRIAIEAGASNFWYHYVGLDGLIIGIDRFGESAPAEDVFALFGFTVNNIQQKILDYLEK